MSAAAWMPGAGRLADVQIDPASFRYAWACAKLGAGYAAAMVGNGSIAGFGEWRMRERQGLIVRRTWKRQEALRALGSARHRFFLHNVDIHVKALRSVRGGSMQMLGGLSLG